MVQVENQKLLFQPKGELTIYEIEEATKQLQQYFEEIQKVRVDLSLTEKIDTAGFQLLVSLKRSCEESHRTFQIGNVTGTVETFMTLLGSDIHTEKDGI